MEGGVPIRLRRVTDLCQHTGGHFFLVTAKTMHPAEAAAVERANPDGSLSDCPKQWSNHLATQPSVRGSWPYALAFNTEVGNLEFNGLQSVQVHVKTNSCYQYWYLGDGCDNHNFYHQRCDGSHWGLEP